MQRVHIFISGIVQGVFFRQFIKENANKLSIKGYAKNLNNERVESVFEGTEINIKRIIELCKKGPVSSKVSNIEIIKEKYKREFKLFEIIKQK